MDPVDRDAPTPRQTGVWAIAFGRASSYIPRLIDAQIAKRAPRAELYDPTGVMACERLIRKFRELIGHFKAWETDRPRQIRDNDAKQAELKAAALEADALLDAMPKKADGSRF